MPDVMTPLTVEPGRLARGIELGVRQLGPRQFAVQGSHEPWYVDLERDEPCDCLDAYYRGRRVLMCKHVIAALFHARDERILSAAGDMLLSRANAREAR